MPYADKEKQLNYMRQWRKRNRARCNANRLAWYYVNHILGQWKENSKYVARYQ